MDELEGTAGAPGPRDGKELLARPAEGAHPITPERNEGREWAQAIRQLFTKLVGLGALGAVVTAGLLYHQNRLISKQVDAQLAAIELQGKQREDWLEQDYRTRKAQLLDTIYRTRREGIWPWESKAVVPVAPLQVRIEAVRALAQLESQRGVQLELPRVNLEGATLDGIDLSGAVLTEAKLAGVSLYEARLTRANLDRADLSGATLDGANLMLASLESAFLAEAQIGSANLALASLCGADLSRTSLQATRFDGAVLFRASFTGAHLSFTDFSGAMLAFSTDEWGAPMVDRVRPDLRSRPLPTDDWIRETFDQVEWVPGLNPRWPEGAPWVERIENRFPQACRDEEIATDVREARGRVVESE